MKTKLAIIILSAVALLSFTAVSSNKGGNSTDNSQPKAYQTGGGHAVTDKGQFN